MAVHSGRIVHLRHALYAQGFDWSAGAIDAVEKEIPESIRKTLAELDGVVLRLAEGSSTRKIGDLEWTIVEADSLVDKWLRDHGLIAALVRPDHYVFAVARQPVDLGRMSDLLNQNLHLVNCGTAPRSNKVGD